MSDIQLNQGERLRINYAAGKGFIDIDQDSTYWLEVENLDRFNYWFVIQEIEHDTHKVICLPGPEWFDDWHARQLFPYEIVYKPKQETK